MMNERNWELEERLCECFGIEIGSKQEEFITNILTYFDTMTMNAVLESIATDQGLEEEEEE